MNLKNKLMKYTTIVKLFNKEEYTKVIEIISALKGKLHPKFYVLKAIANSIIR